MGRQTGCGVWPSPIRHNVHTCRIKQILENTWACRKVLGGHRQVHAAGLLLKNRVRPRQDIRESRHVGAEIEIFSKLTNPGRVLRYHTARDVAGPQT